MKKTLIYLLGLLFVFPLLGNAGLPPTRCQETDGTPSFTCYVWEFTNGSLSQSGTKALIDLTVGGVVAAGVSGGQTIIGGTDSGDNLTLESTSNATKGQVDILDEVTIGDNTPVVDTATLYLNALAGNVYNLYMKGIGGIHNAVWVMDNASGTDLVFGLNSSTANEAALWMNVLGEGSSLSLNAGLNPHVKSLVSGRNLDFILKGSDEFDWLDDDTTSLMTLDDVNLDVKVPLVGTDDITSSDTGDIGWTVQSAANQVCTTTCTFAAVFGQDTGTGNIVGPADATADICVCAGAN